MRPQPLASARALRITWVVSMTTCVIALAAGDSTPADACIDYREYAHQVAFRTSPNDIQECVIVADRLYMANPEGFYVFDVSDAAFPQQLGSFELAGDPRGIALVGDHVFLASGAAGLIVMRIADPTAPALVAQLDLGAIASDISLSGDHAFIAMGRSGMAVVDVRDPAAPEAVARMDTPGSALRLDVEGSFAFIADSLDLRIARIADPRHPTLTGSVSWNAGPVDVVEHDGLLFVADGSVRMIDVDPLSRRPPRIHRVSISGGVVRVATAGDLVFALGGDSFNSVLSMIEFGHSSGPAVVGRLTVKGRPVCLSVDGRHACVSGGGYGYSIVDVTPPVTAPRVGRCGDAIVLAVTARGDFAYTGYLWNRYFRVVDISDPANPQSRGELVGLRAATRIALYGDYAVVANRGDGFYIVDVHDPDHPTLLGSWWIAGQPYDLAVYRHYAVVPSGTVRIVDLTNPSQPVVVGIVSPPGGADNIDIAGDFAYSAGPHVLSVIDLTDPTHPAVLGSVEVERHVSAVAVSGSLAFLATNDGFYVVDIGDPAHPTAASFVSDVYNCEGIAAFGQYAYACADRRGVLIFDASDPSRPRQIGSMDTPDYAYTASVAADYACVADGSGLVVIHAQCAGREVATAPSPAGGTPLLWLGRGRPEPFRTSTAIDFTLGAPANIALEVLDPSGRVVRTLARGTCGAGTRSVTWDGRTDTGAHAAPGVYYCRLVRGARSCGGRLTLLP